MELKKVQTDKAPAAIGPYSQAIIAGDLLFSSGQIPLDPATGEVSGNDIVSQTERVMMNVSEILAAAGSGFDKVIKTTCFLADMADFAEFNKVYESYMISKPARSTVAVKDLPKGVLVEVETIAAIG